MTIKVLNVGLWIASILCSVRFAHAEQGVEAEAVLRKTGSFALGGVGAAGTMSEGERALREILKKADATARLQTMLPNASPAGQLYALLALRVRDRTAYQQALEKYGGNNPRVQTAHGCILQQESFRDLVRQIEHGDYDNFLARPWPETAP
jgi:hypothetical protein